MLSVGMMSVSTLSVGILYVGMLIIVILNVAIMLNIMVTTINKIFQSSSIIAFKARIISVI
jgi:hypothetical protein